MNAQTLERLAAAGIQLLTPDAKTHYVFVRENFVSLVERTAEGTGSIGSTGLFTEHGLVYLVWRNGQAFFAGKGGEQPAAPGLVAALRRFSADLEGALRF